MNKVSKYKQWLWIFMAFVFILGIFSSIGQMETVSGKAFPDRHGFSAEQQTRQHAEILPVESLHEMDDFNINFAVRKGQRNDLENVRGIVLFIVSTALLLFYICIERFWIFFGERQIPYFYIVRFIHQMDGKKKSCFVARTKQQNRRS